MNKFILYAIVLALLAAIGCSKNPEKVLPRKDGTWHYEEGQIVNGNRNVFDFGTVVFEKGGSGTINNENFTWEYQEEDKITMSYSNGVTIDYTIVETSAKAQRWTQGEWTDPMNGNIVENDMTLTKEE